MKPMIKSEPPSYIACLPALVAQKYVPSPMNDCASHLLAVEVTVNPPLIALAQVHV